MPLLVRRINRSKWYVTDDEGALLRDILADTLTGDLKTNRNCISLWEIVDESEIEKAVLALTSGSKQTDFSTIHVVMLMPEQLASAGLEIEPSEGDTAISGLRNLHRDITNLRYSTLGVLSNCIIDSIIEERVKTFTRLHVRELFRSALRAGNVDTELLDPTLRERNAKVFEEN